MATTTPNFGWAVPTSTDLVKDGAVAIETLGDAIDASLVDLKGGTTGQVLKKNTNTDMDFVWSSDAAGMTNPMTTTGDTIYSSSGSTPARLGIGTTGQVLTVASGVPSWATPAGGGGMTLLSTTAITAANAINVTSISGSYTNLIVYVENFKMNTNQTNIFFRFNNDSSAIYDTAATNSVNSAVLYQTGATSMFVGGYANLGNSGNNTLVIQIPFYSTTASYKTIDFNLSSNYGTSGYLNAGGFVGMASTSAITEVNLFAGGGTNFAAQGNIKIYGVN
jgi:hypothetical protein